MRRNPHRSRGVTFAILTMFCLIGPVDQGTADEEAAALTFRPVWNALCGIGSELATGCDAVRSRRIVDASASPWSAIGRVNFSGYRTRQHCTGTMIGRRIVLTAAHCLYDGTRKTWIRPNRIHFLAGYQRGAQTARSTVISYQLSHSHNVESRVFRYNPAEDWALLKLQKPIGDKTGFLGWSGLDGAGLENSLPDSANLVLAGYPAIRQHVLSVDEDCHEPEFATGNIMIVRCAAMAGDSGGPVMMLTGNQAIIVAVFTGSAVSNGNLFGIAVPTFSIAAEIEKILNETN